jgi:diaminohydroxyphosphoribosylaminopyrimidine deaminase/5-amino-6-(5-phosphoribosylamino)uracil reductase
MAREAQRVNEKYLHFMRTGRPFVHLKMAVSLDGKIATRTGDSRWIAGPEARARAQEFRHECDAILVGVGTVALDDPLLTDRSFKPRRKALIRVVLDERMQMSPASQLARTATETPVIVFTGRGSSAPAADTLKAQGVEIISDESGGRDVLKVLEELGKLSIQSVLIEGGSHVAGALIDAQLVNKVTFFIAPLIIGGQAAPAAVGGVGAAKMADAWRLSEVEIFPRGADIEVTGYCPGTSL